MIGHDPSHQRYSAIHSGIALPKADLAATVLRPTHPLPDGRQYALHPAMGNLAALFNTGRAAVQLNVGPLVAPVTRVQYAGSDRTNFPLPPKLFSHNDQESVWQSSQAEGSTVGWGGKLGDLARAAVFERQLAVPCISVSGNVVFLAGDNALGYQVSPGGAVRAAMNTLIQQNRANVLENEYNKMTARSIGAETQISGALSGVALGTEFPAGNWLANQLKMLARLIGARSRLGAKRQAFFGSLGGFDLHDNRIAQQPALLGKVSAALTAFHQATLEMGVPDKVTAFTASDFGRTLSLNGDGSDHASGSHHFMVGGAVKGQAFYGTAPPVGIGNSGAPEDQWHVGQGRLLPSASSTQYAATLARWFGVADAELSGILPNVGNSGAPGHADYPRDLGFMA